MLYITCQAELILSYITCKVYMISGNEVFRFSPPLMKYIILPDTKTFDKYIRHFYCYYNYFSVTITHLFLWSLQENFCSGEKLGNAKI